MRDAAFQESEDEETWYHSNSTPMVSRMLPLLTWEQASNWNELFEKFKPSDTKIWIPCTSNHGPRAFALKITDNSMFNPEGLRSFNEGDYIFVDPDSHAYHECMIILKMPDGTMLFRQLLIEPDKKAILKPINPDWPDQPVEATKETSLCGVVIGKTGP